MQRMKQAAGGPQCAVQPPQNPLGPMLKMLWGSRAFRLMVLLAFVALLLLELMRR